MSEKITELEYLKKLLSFSSKKYESEALSIAENYPDFNHLLHRDSYGISKLAGVSEQSTELLHLVAALTSRRITDKYKIGKNYLQNDIEDLIVGLFFGCKVEIVYALFFDSNNKLISIDHMGEGTVNSSTILPRKLVEVATKCKASSVIIAHNHPCGSTKPSKEDLSSNTFISGVLKNIGVELSGHYIVSGFETFDCYSKFETAQR